MADWYFRNKPPKSPGLNACPGCRNLVSNNAELCPYCGYRLRNRGGMHELYKRYLSGPDMATRVLLGLMVVVFCLQLLVDVLLPERDKFPVSGGFSLFGLLTGNPMTYILMGSNFHPFTAYYHQYWRLLTYCFLHYGVLHIVFNGYAFWNLGRLAEQLWGRRQVFAVFILTGIAGGTASFVWNFFITYPKNSAGASGAICGILGLLLGAYYRNRYHVGEYLGTQLVRWAVYILVFGLVAGADNAAHIGGMLSGAVMGYFLPPTRSSRTLVRDDKVWNAAAILSLILLVVCIGFALAFFIQGPQHVMSLMRR